MKAGIRTKLVLLLSAASLVPLLGALVAIIITGRQLRLERVQQSFLAVGTTEVQYLKAALVADVQQLVAVFTKPNVLAALSERTEPLSPDELQRLDSSWEAYSEKDSPLAKVLDGPGASALRALQANNRHFAEIFITDRFGQLVVATNRTTDFYQADEEWWEDTFWKGKGRLVIPPIHLDLSSGVWSVDICVPIQVEEETVGIGKASVDIGRWVGQLKRSVGMVLASVKLVSREGQVIYPAGSASVPAWEAEWTGEIADGTRSGFRITRDGEIEVYVPIWLTRADVGRELQMTWFTLILYVSESEAFGPIYRMSLIGLVIGLVAIAVLFLSILYLIDRRIVQRILRITAVARRVAKGDLTARVEFRRTPRAGEDEIDELRGDFNHMIGEVERSYRELATANELKQNFIRVAGHELRTPVSYLTAITKLLKNTSDVRRLKEALSSMGVKAERLNSIVQSMFKLMPEGVLPRELNCSDFTVGEILEEVRAEVHPFIEERRQRLVIDTKDGNASLRADRPKLFDVLQNLVANAIKFTPDGGEVRISARLDEGNRAVFAVTDQGEGIPQEELPRLFQPFSSGGDILKHSTGESGYQKRGMGLGLAIVKYFVTLHGGTVQTATGPSGSTFTVTIPARREV